MKTKIFDQHSEHGEWLNKLDFYKDELKIMQTRLQEVSSKNTKEEVRKEIEHFQNQFIIQEKNSDDLRRHISTEEKKIKNVIKHNPVSSDHRTAEDHGKERSMVKSFEDNFNKLRHEYNRFLGKAMW